MFKDFKEFAIKGNLISMAVGVIIGGAFGKIVTSLVNDLLMPLLGLLMGGVDLTGYAWAVAPVFGEGEGVVIRYGAFLQSVVDFLIIAVSIFLFMRLVTKLLNRVKKEEEAAPPPPKSEEVLLLEEIRDLLKEERKTE